MTPRVSVVVPIYKVEGLLRRCLDSLLAQTYRHLELVLVDDGSPDGCPAIVDEYAAAHPGLVRAIHQENRGLGPARNRGLEAATGEYVAFVDSDDYVAPTYVETMLARCLQENAEVCVCNFFVDFASGRRLPFPMMTVHRRLSGEKAGKRSLDLLTIPTFAWNKLYRRDLFLRTGLRFPDMYYEDMATVAQVMAEAHRVALTHKPLYHYCLRESSITGTFTEKNLRDYLRAVEIIRDFIWDSGRWDDWAASYLRFLLSAWVHVQGTLLARPGIPFDERLRVMRETDRAFQRLRPPPARPPQPRPDTPVVLPPEEDLPDLEGAGY